jgi:hypothetical protein
LPPILSCHVVALVVARCVVVVGLPYPNRTDVELQARMQYLDKLAAQTATGKAAAGPTAAAGAADASAGHPGADLQQQQQGGDSQPDSQQQQQQGMHATRPSCRTAFQVLNQARPRDAPAAVGKSPLPPTKPPAAAAATGGSETMADASASQQHTRGTATAPTAAAAAGGHAGNPAVAAKAAGTAHQQNTNAPGGSSSSSSGSFTGRDFYEDLCFKAVNQCVGRVVRHRGDYAAVVLLDTRWVVGPSEWAALAGSSGGSSGSTRRIVPVQKLPGWLQRSYVPSNGDFGPALKQLAAFFKRQAHKAAA